MSKVSSQPNEKLPFSKESVAQFLLFMDQTGPINDRVLEGINRMGKIDVHNADDFDKLILIANNLKLQSRSVFEFFRQKQQELQLFEAAFRENKTNFVLPKANLNLSQIEKSIQKRVELLDKSKKNELEFVFGEKYRQESMIVKQSFREGKKEAEPSLDQVSMVGGSMKLSMVLSATQRRLLQFKVHEYIIKLQLSEVYKRFPVRERAELREGLPAFRDPKNSINLWSIFKENIGKDLSKITMPVYTKEPITMLQKFGEFIEYLYLLKTANATEDKHLRIIFVSAVLYILYANTINRLKQPFNSLLGETYEYIDGDVKIVMEQVCNHPPILSFFCDSLDFQIKGDFWLKSQLSIASFEFIAIGEFNVHLKKWNEDYSFERPATSLHNYILGTMYFWIKGSLKCTNLTTQDKIEIIFRPKGWSSKHDYEVTGNVSSSDKQVHYTVHGKWNAFLAATNVKTKVETEIVRKSKPVANYEQQYFFSGFTLGMNYLNLFRLHEIAPTDSRLRPDLRAYENGDFELAAIEKNRLEENQRNRRKMLKEKGLELKPYWFQVEVKDKTVSSKYNGGYFECREKNTWPKDLLDLYND